MIILLFATVAWLGLSNVSPLHPAAVSLLTRTQTETLECQDSGDVAGSVLESPKPSRTSNFRLSGSYNCYRPLFRSDERNPYVDRVLQAETDHAHRVAVTLAKQLEGRLLGPVQLRIEGVDNPALTENLAALYRAELTSTLGAGQVSRTSGENAHSPILKIEIHRSDVAEQMASVYVHFPESKGAIHWKEL